MHQVLITVAKFNSGVFEHHLNSVLLLIHTLHHSLSTSLTYVTPNE